MNATTRLGLLGLAMTLSACSVLESDKIDYKSATKGATLEVPPDLNQLSRETRYTVPGGAVSASAFEAGQAQQPRGAASAAPQAIGDVAVSGSNNLTAYASAPPMATINNDNKVLACASKTSPVVRRPLRFSIAAVSAHCA